MWPFSKRQEPERRVSWINDDPGEPKRIQFFFDRGTIYYRKEYEKTDDGITTREWSTWWGIISAPVCVVELKDGLVCNMMGPGQFNWIKEPGVVE